MPNAQHRGGLNNFRGNRYEDFFAVWRVAEALRRHASGVSTSLALQLEGATIDDWVEHTSTERRYYALKRVAKQRWPPALRRLFHEQRRRSPSACCVLVVHLHSRAHALTQHPRKPRGSEVVLFADHLTPMAHCETAGPTRTALEALVDLPEATTSELHAIWGELHLGWLNARKPGEFVPAVAVLDALGDQQLPIRRRSWRPTRRWARAKRLLERVPHLHFGLGAGWFHYSTAGGIAGRISCRSDAFTEFLAKVIQHHPRRVSKVLELLS